MISPAPPLPPELSLTRLASFCAETTFKPDEALISLIGMALIDTVGCFLSGANQQVSIMAQKAFSDLGPATAPVFGTTIRTEPSKAALLNAVAGHAVEFDDWEMVGNTHPSNVLFASILAAAGDRPVSGKAVMDAYLAGFEVIARLGEAINFEHYDQGWHATGTLGAIGAAASISRLWGLNAEQTANALSIATSRAIALTSQFGSDTKPLQAGFAAETGIVAARLAAQGLTGQPDILDAPKGFFALTGHRDTARHAAAMEKLGTMPALEEHGLVFKLYPSCGYSHRLIDCAVELFNGGTVNPDDIDKITLHLPTLHAAVVPFIQPENRPQALFSLPFCVSVALTSGDVMLADFDSERWRDPAIRALIGKTEIVPFKPQRPELNYAPQDPDRLDVLLGDGTTHTATVVYPKGSPPNPASEQRLIEKFKQNAALGSRLQEPEMTEALGRFLAWPSADDVIGCLIAFHK